MTCFKPILLILILFFKIFSVNGQENFHKIDSSETRVFTYGLYPSLKLFQPQSFNYQLNKSRSYIHNHNINLMIGYQRFMFMVGLSSQYIVFNDGIEQLDGGYNSSDRLVSEFWNFRFGYKYLELNRIYLNTFLNYDLLKFDHFTQNNNNIGIISGTEISISNDIGYKLFRLFSLDKNEVKKRTQTTVDISINIQLRFGYSSYISSHGENISPFFFSTHFGLVTEMGWHRLK